MQNAQGQTYIYTILSDNVSLDNAMANRFLVFSIDDAVDIVMNNMNSPETQFLKAARLIVAVGSQKNHLKLKRFYN